MTSFQCPFCEKRYKTTVGVFRHIEKHPAEFSKIDRYVIEEDDDERSYIFEEII